MPADSDHWKRKNDWQTAASNERRMPADSGHWKRTNDCQITASNERRMPADSKPLEEEE